MRILLSLLCFVATGCAGMGLEPFNGEGEGSVLVIDPDDLLDFGAVDLTGAPPTDVVILSSTGDAPVAVIDVYLDQYTSGAFALGQLPLPIRLKPDSDFPVEIEFTPDAIGQFSGTLIIEEDLGDGDLVQHEVAVSGEGCNPAAGGC